MENRSKRLARDVRVLARDARWAFKDTADDLSDRIMSAGSTAYNAARDGIGTCMKTTDATIRTHPYAAMALALGLGMVVGFLALRNK